MNFCQSSMYSLEPLRLVSPSTVSQTPLYSWNRTNGRFKAAMHKQECAHSHIASTRRLLPRYHHHHHHNHHTSHWHAPLSSNVPSDNGRTLIHTHECMHLRRRVLVHFCQLFHRVWDNARFVLIDLFIVMDSNCRLFFLKTQNSMNQSPVMYSDSNSPITPVVTFLRESQCSKYIRVLFVFVILLVVRFKIILATAK